MPARDLPPAFIDENAGLPEPGELDCETHRAASLNYERVAQIVTEAFNRYHRGEHSDPVFIEQDIADGIFLERRRLRREVESDA